MDPMTFTKHFFICGITTILAVSTVACRREAPPEPAPAVSASVRAHGSIDLQWEDDWDKALARAAAENRPVLVSFSADWCIWCRRLESTTFADNDVRTLLSEMVLLELEIDGNGRQRAVALGVEAPPTLLVLAADGQETGRILGYMPPSSFLDRLRGLMGLTESV